MDDTEFSERIEAVHKEGVRLLNEISSLIDDLDKKEHLDVS